MDYKIDYKFDILGVSPVLSFFDHQQSVQRKHPCRAFEYVGAYKCQLDAFIEPISTVSAERGWDTEAVVQTLIRFWMANSEQIEYWHKRLIDAGSENLLVARMASEKALKALLESLLAE